MCNVHQLTADSASTNAMPVKISLMRLPFVTEGFVKKGILVPEGEKSKNRRKSWRLLKGKPPQIGRFLVRRPSNDDVVSKKQFQPNKTIAQCATHKHQARKAYVTMNSMGGHNLKLSCTKNYKTTFLMAPSKPAATTTFRLMPMLKLSDGASCKLSRSRKNALLCRRRSIFTRAAIFETFFIGCALVQWKHVLFVQGHRTVQTVYFVE